MKALKPLVLALVLGGAASAASAGPLTISLPHLTWPHGESQSVSPAPAVSRDVTVEVRPAG
ncbi:hypothetical protein [Tropicimonas sp. IMCC34011]|uniref:hypothetical protein n=1 Tax=Tropicimonas sp. IMCC34011 TaxID=2248759 RepID=UPI000E22C918|nr:hypothetical protein [Tropicimonas sp. IMCC34011]